MQTPIKMTAPPNEDQEAAFLSLCNPETNRLRHPIESKEGGEALATLNRATRKNLLQLKDCTNYAISSTILQGACLLAAVFSQLDIMATPWVGPYSPLAERTVSVLSSFAGTKLHTVSTRVTL